MYNSLFSYFVNIPTDYNQGVQIQNRKNSQGQPYKYFASTPGRPIQIYNSNEHVMLYLRLSLEAQSGYIFCDDSFFFYCHQIQKSVT